MQCFVRCSLVIRDHLYGISCVVSAVSDGCWPELIGPLLSQNISILGTFSLTKGPCLLSAVLDRQSLLEMDKFTNMRTNDVHLIGQNSYVRVRGIAVY